ncbi:uncharacterized protein LOC143288357 [Babylonia areolata]|uniref:uncharacterized protein LOC143288357 n=1 Tax=Babylonia areolata TaxID=304850 RepID=UPI003FD539CB
MFLTRFLQFYKRHRGTPGLLRAGKHRALPYISVSLKREALKWLMLEQQNLEVLSKPYLTPEEEYHSAKTRKEQKSFIQKKLEEQQAKMLPHRTANDIFTNLYRQRRWE